jgi:hypothetical protein
MSGTLPFDRRRQSMTLNGAAEQHEYNAYGSRREGSAGSSSYGEGHGGSSRHLPHIMDLKAKAEARIDIHATVRYELVTLGYEYCLISR